MNQLLLFIELEEPQLEKALILAIVLFFSVSLLFLSLTLIKKTSRKKKAQKKEQYQNMADSLLFHLLFMEASLEETLTLFEQQKINSNLFNKVMIKAIVALHNNYTGVHKKKLEEFYVKSGIINYSLNKVNSNKTVHIIEGIRDLSSLNYQPVYKIASKLLTHKEESIKCEALTAIIVLKGCSELLKFVNINFYVDDWTQSNILYAIRKKADQAPEHLHLLLKSKNESMILLGARLIEYYQQTHHYEAMELAAQNMFYTFRNRQKMMAILKRQNKFSVA